MTSEIPDYAKNNGGDMNWLKAGKSVERTAFYKSQYEKEKVKMDASQKLKDLFKDMETSVDTPSQKIASGDTLSKFLLRSFKSEALMWQGLKNLQEQGYQVDWFPTGYTVEISNNKLSLFKDVNGEKTYFKSPETGVAVKDLKVFDHTEEPEQPVKEEVPVPQENPLLEERWNYVLEEVQTSLGDEFTLSTVNQTDSPSGLDRTLKISFNGRTEEVNITHAIGVTADKAFSNDALTVIYKDNSYPTVGRAAYAASLELKPEKPKEAPRFKVDETLLLSEQWNAWKAEIAEVVISEGMTLEIKKEKDAVVRLLIHNGDRKETILIRRDLAAKNGGYTDKDAEISCEAYSYEDPLAAVKAAIRVLKNPKEKIKITMPWQKHEHDEGEDSHDGHAH